MGFLSDWNTLKMEMLLHHVRKGRGKDGSLNIYCQPKLSFHRPWLCSLEMKDVSSKSLKILLLTLLWIPNGCKHFLCRCSSNRPLNITDTYLAALSWMSLLGKQKWSKALRGIPRTLLSDSETGKKERKKRKSCIQKRILWSYLNK